MLRNPDETPDIGSLEPIRRLIGGETPAERTARIEEEQKKRALRILERKTRRTSD